jgi:hypothetical protein
MYGDQKKLFRSLVLFALVLVVLAGVAYWKLTRPVAGPYGAIAMSESSLTYGGAWGYADPLTAYKRSITECNQAGGKGDCVVKVSLKDNCGALAISVQANRSFLVTGTDQVRTTQVAMGQCEATGAGDCQVRENICSSAS